MSETKATATGSLGTTPFPHLLVYALDKRLTGTLVLETPDAARSAVLLDQGIPVKAKSAISIIRLGELLVEQGVLSDEQLAEVDDIPQQQRGFYGQSLLQRQLVDADTLRFGLEEQLVRRVSWMFGLPAECVYGYYDGRNFLERWGAEPTPVDPLTVLGRGVRTHPDLRIIDETLSRLGTRTLRLHLDSKVGRFRFNAGEQAVADVLRLKPQPLDQLIASEIADPATTRRVVYTLAITRHLDMGIPGARPVGVVASVSGMSAVSAPSIAPSTSERPSAMPRRTPSFNSMPAAGRMPPAPVTPPTMAPAAPPELSTEHQKLRAELLERSKILHDLDYYELLGVAPRATAADIQAAFFVLAKRWHPDRLPAELAELRDLVSRAFGRMSEAAQVLGDEQRRKQYDAELRSKATHAETDEEAQIQRVLRAATSFQKAQVLLRTNHVAAAEQEAKSAMEDDPDQGEYRALWAWLVSQKPTTPPETLSELLRMLDRSVKSEPKNDRILFYRAQINKRAGREEAAYRDFRKVLEMNPRNIDAAREVRLYKMRKPGHSSSPPPPRAGKSIGKFFKR
jgi:curved DNA-binding protein CbpA